MVLILIVTGLGAGIADYKDTEFAHNGKIYRNPPGEGDWEEKAEVFVPEENTEYSLHVTVLERSLSRAEEQDKIQSAIAEIEATFCGENASLEEIQKNPVIMDSYQDGMVTAEWSFSEECINLEGTIDETLLGNRRVLTEAQVQLSCGESEGIYRFYFYLVPKEKSNEERLLADIYEQIKRQDTTKEEVELPTEADGKTLYWQKAKSYQYLEIWVVGVLAVIAVAYAKREQELKKIQRRKAQLLLEYPEFVSKLSLLLGAGMHVLTAFRKINQMSKGIVCIELQKMLNEIENGMSEMRAYGEFAKRCDLQPYRKLVSLLQSGQKMGNRELIERLEEEADRVFAERKNTARKLGEEAGTKLLFPMMMMLIIVMGIVIFPAFLSIYQM